MTPLPGEKARINTARWILSGYIVFAVAGILLHIITRQLRGEPIIGTYVVSITAIGMVGFYALMRLPKSINQAMLTFACIAMACVTGLLIHALHYENYYRNLLFMFHIGIFSVGLVLGFRPAIYCTIVTSAIIIALGTVYRLHLSNDIVIPIFFAFAVTLPSKVVEQLIEQSTAELSAINLQLEDQVEARTAELRAEIVERQHAQEVLSERTAELEKRNEELDAYAHTVAHDLKAPLASVIGFSDLLDKRHEKIPPDKLAYYCNIIAQNGRKIVNIVDALLLLASVRKVDEVPTERLDLPEILEDIQRRLADAILESEAEIVVPDCWPDVTCYQPWVEEILANYISNAIKYGGKPPRIEVGSTNHIDGYVRFWVRDNGKGLTPEEQARLFIPFTRLDQIRVKGYGLGLSIVQRIAEKLNGQVGVESEVGQGCTFYFNLPLVGSDT